MSQPVITDDDERSRLEVRVGDELAGWLAYHHAGEIFIVEHTEVDRAHEGEGLGGLLVRRALEVARARGMSVVATCPFAVSYFDRHPELDEFLAPWARRRPRG